MIKKIFIKNYKDTSNNEVRNEYAKVASIFGIITNIFLGIIKLILGFITNSVSIMADAANNISDTFSSVLTIVGFKLSSKERDDDHPYGYARYEYISAYTIALFMIIMGVLFLKESITKVISPVEIEINIATYIILIIAVIVKIYQMILYFDFAKSINSNVILATATETKNDIITTSAILFSMIVMSIFNINIDGYLGIFVSLFVITNSINTLKETIEPIIGIKPTKERVDEIRNKLKTYDIVCGIHDLVIHDYGANNDFVTVHVEVDSKKDIVFTHDKIDNIEKDFKDEFGIDLTIHMDPIVIDNKKINKIKNKVVKVISDFDKELTIHDFRMVEGKTHTNILFDIVIPYKKKYNTSDIIKVLNENIKEKNKKYYYVIEIDRSYI